MRGLLRSPARPRLEPSVGRRMVGALLALAALLGSCVWTPPSSALPTPGTTGDGDCGHRFCRTTAPAVFPGGLCRRAETGLDTRTGEVLFVRDRGPAPCPFPVSPPVSPRLCTTLTLVETELVCTRGAVSARLRLPTPEAAIAQDAGSKRTVLWLTALPAAQTTTPAGLTLRLEPVGVPRVGTTPLWPQRPVVLPGRETVAALRAPYRLRVRREVPSSPAREVVEDARAIAGLPPENLLPSCDGETACLLLPLRLRLLVPTGRG